MKNQHRMILAVVVIFVALMLYPRYLKWVSPPAPETGEVPVAEEMARSIQKTAAQPTQTVPEKEEKIVHKGEPEEFYDLENDTLTIAFSTLGGTIKQLEAKRFINLHQDDATLIDIEKGLRGSYALVFPFEKSGIDRAIFKRDKSLEKNGDMIAFSTIKDKAIKITKIFRMLPKESTLELEVILENLSNSYQDVQYELSTQMFFSKKDAEGYNRNSLESGARVDGKVKSKNVGSIQKKGFLVEGIEGWIFVSKKYFTLITKPIEANFQRSRSIKLNDNEIANFALMPKIDLAPGERKSQTFLLYGGAKEYNVLKSYNAQFQEILSKGFFGTFRIWLLLALQFLHKYLHNWGWAIVAITVLIKIAFTPLTHMSFQSMKRMQHFQPQVKALQEKYKKEPQKMNKEVMAFYKKHKVNPMSGCLPMLLQMPVFIAFYQVLYQAIELKGAPFIFWITDLSAPDKLMTLPFSLPFLGDGLNVLPIIMMVSMIWQQKLTPTAGAPEQQKMMMFMPVIFGFIFYNLPSGLVLYWTVNNILTILHQKITKKYIPHPHLPHHGEHKETK
jgi:YidC/Oxa1 family membrane protein insertase